MHPRHRCYGFVSTLDYLLKGLCLTLQKGVVPKNSLGRWYCSCLCSSVQCIPLLLGLKWHPGQQTSLVGKQDVWCCVSPHVVSESSAWFNMLLRALASLFGLTLNLWLLYSVDSLIFWFPFTPRLTCMGPKCCKNTLWRLPHLSLWVISDVSKLIDITFRCIVLTIVT